MTSGIGKLRSALERLVREYRRRQQAHHIGGQVKRYYDSLSDEEVVEDRRWGKFAESQFRED